MPLTDAQLQQVHDWLNQRGVNQCPLCERNEWGLGGLVAAPALSQGNVDFGAPTLILVQMVCGNCAYVAHFAAGQLGVAD